MPFPHIFPISHNIVLTQTRLSHLYQHNDIVAFVAIPSTNPYWSNHPQSALKTQFDERVIDIKNVLNGPESKVPVEERWRMQTQLEVYLAVVTLNNNKPIVAADVTLQ